MAFYGLDQKLLWRVDRRQWNDPRGVISHSLKFIYLPIAKVANISLKDWIIEIKAIGHVDRNQLIFNQEGTVIRNFNKRDYPGYYKFAFVRNPWSRLVSCYASKILTEKVSNQYFKEGIPRSLHKYGVFKAGMSFADFVGAVCGIPDRISDDHFKSQHCFLRDKHNHWIPDFIGRFEQLEEDLKTICKNIGIRYHHNLERKNQSQHPHYKTLYDGTLKRKVGKRYKMDIWFFDYKF